MSVSYIAKGGEAIVYRLEHTGHDEVVAKTPVFNESMSLA